MSSKINNWLELINKKKSKKEYIKELKEKVQAIKKEEEFKKDLTYFTALGNELRLVILKLLESESLCTCVLAETFGMSESSISHHLRILENAGLIIGSKKGLYTAYYTKSNLIAELSEKK
ncbi:MAG: ArsR/SmtB family transcription factor [Candidatus Heimdallarchaeota archaeon]